MRAVVLLTDFGLSDPFVGQMKGVLLAGAPDVAVVDLSHDIRPFDVLQAAFFLAASAPYFPEDTLFLSVVDPGVGTSRRLVLVQKNNQLFLAPDNGLLSLVVQKPGLVEAWEIQAPEAPTVSRTFHGRDLLAPTVVQLCQGIGPDRLGRAIPVETIVSHPLAIPVLTGQTLTASILHQDRFGNLILNLAIDSWLAPFQEIHGPLSITSHGNRFPVTLAMAYADIPAQHIGIIPGSQGYLELALNQQSAAAKLHCSPGDPIVFTLGEQTPMKQLPAPRHFFLALSFLTRLGRPAPASPEELGKTLPYFPLVGLVVAAGAVGPVYALNQLGVGRDLPWLLALILCGCQFFITRGLHWDGWTDIWDAWGSGATGDRFWEILKDSRLGAFGAMGLFFGLAGQLILIEYAIRTNQWIVLIWALVHGRAGAVFLAHAGRLLARPGLAQAFLTKAGPLPTILVLAQTLGLSLLCLSWPRIVAALILTGLGGLALFLLARKQTGLSGDFLGAMIIWSESAVLLATVPLT